MCHLTNFSYVFVLLLGVHLTQTENGGAKHYLEMESDDVPAVPDGYFAFSAAV